MGDNLLLLMIKMAKKQDRAESTTIHISSYGIFDKNI